MTTSPLAPGVFPVALDGRPFLLDYSGDGGYVSGSIPVLRNQSDQGARPGEQSLSPEDLWRRVVESWHHGAGQTHADRSDADQFRFRTSLHVDPWTKHQLKRLTTPTFTAYASERGELATTDGFTVYWLSDDRIYNLDLATSVTGLPAQMRSMCPDGYFVYSVHGTEDVYQIQGSTGTSYVTNASENLNLIRFAKDRLLVFDTNGAVYNPTAAGALPAAFFTHRLGAQWTWSDAVDGVSNIYMSGHGAGQGAIYRVGIEPDGTSLDTPIIAGRLPDGELPLSLEANLGLIHIGTSSGVRTAVERDDGSLAIGDLISGPVVRCLDAFRSQVWFGWDQFDDFPPELYGGLGRIDLSGFDGEGAPPYATDLMVETGLLDKTTAVQVTENGQYFVRSGGVGFSPAGGLYFAANGGAANVEGQVVSGLFNFGLTEPKTFHYLSVGSGAIESNSSGEPVVSAFVRDISPYDAAGDAATLDFYDPVGRTNLSVADLAKLNSPDTVITANDALFDLGGRRSQELEYRLLVGDKISRVTLQGRPAVTSRSERIRATLIVAHSEDVDGQDRPRDVREAVAHVRDLVRNASPVSWQDGNETYPVIVEDYQFTRTHEQETAGEFNGAITVSMKRHDTVTPLFRSGSTATGTAVNALTVTAPESAQASDVSYAVATWTQGVAVPTAAGWTLLGETSPSQFEAATWWRTGAGDLDLVFASPVEVAAAVATYSTGAEIVFEEVQVQTEADSMADQFVESENLVPAGIAAIVGLAAVQTTDGAVLNGPTRPRVTARLVTGPQTITSQIGDAISTSTFNAVGLGLFDRISHAWAFNQGQAAVFVNRLL